MNNKSNNDNSNNNNSGGTSNNNSNSSSTSSSSSSDQIESNNDNNEIDNTNNNNNEDNNISELSSPTRSREERELENRRQRQHILLMKSNKMFKRCCCYMLILSLAVLLPTYTAATVTATETILVTTDAPPTKRLTTAAAEILQLPHAFHHRVHYSSHRIEQAVNDFKRAQLQQSKERDKNLTTKAPFNEVDNTNTNTDANANANAENDNSYNKNGNNFPQSWQFEAHHRRHEQHYLQQNDKRQHLLLLEHHLRHSNGQNIKWEERVLPPMRHERHQRHQRQMKQQNFVISTAPPARLVEGKSTDNQRLSLNLKDDTFGNDFYDSSEYNDNENPDDNNNEDDDDGGDGDGDDDDYNDDDSYESDSKESVQQNSLYHSNNGYSTIDGKAASVKRYTNPFASHTKNRWNFFNEQKSQSNNDQRDKIKNFAGVDIATGTGIGATIEENTDNDTNSGNKNNNNNDDSENFTKEKWHRIQEKHYRQQQQHQHEMQALRLRHNPPAPAPNQILQNERHNNKNEEIIDSDSVYSNNYIAGTLTLQKIEELGTAEAVQETRRIHNYKRKENRDLANAHAKQISSEATCRIPQRRVERIQLHPSKTYMPHCTILHRCADDTGCCRSERETCAPKRWKNVDLYFWVKDMDRNKPTIERLTFVNHTECHCIERSQQKPDEYHDSYHLASNNGHDYIALRRATILNCNCPKFFEKILQEDGFCRCDCSSGNTDCNWLKRGMEHFSVIDRKCMLEGRCKPPTCEYGTYLRKHGRCPRHKEQLAYALSGSTNNNLPSTKSFH